MQLEHIRTLRRLGIIVAVSIVLVGMVFLLLLRRVTRLVVITQLHDVICSARMPRTMDSGGQEGSRSAPACSSAVAITPSAVTLIVAPGFVRHGHVRTGFTFIAVVITRHVVVLCMLAALTGPRRAAICWAFVKLGFYTVNKPWIHCSGSPTSSPIRSRNLCSNSRRSPTPRTWLQQTNCRMFMLELMCKSIHLTCRR